VVSAEAGEQRPYRVLVTASRTWNSAAVIRRVLAAILAEHPGAVLVSGRCPRGGDALAEYWWARLCGYASPAAAIEAGRIEPHPAQWQRDGRKAGYARNAEMVAAGADVCVAFTDPCADPRCRKRGPHGSHGSVHCAGLAEVAGIETRRYEVRS
jgi:hypothetical protein